MNEHSLTTYLRAFICTKSTEGGGVKIPKFSRSVRDNSCCSQQHRRKVMNVYELATDSITMSEVANDRAECSCSRFMGHRVSYWCLQGSSKKVSCCTVSTAYFVLSHPVYVELVAVKLQQWPTRGVAVAVGTVSFTLTAEMTSHRAGHLVVTHEWSVCVVDVMHTPLFS